MAVFAQGELNKAAQRADMKCSFSTTLLRGLQCKRGEPSDFCWQLNVTDTTHTPSSSGCKGELTRDECAQSTLTARVFETMWPATPHAPVGVSVCAVKAQRHTGESAVWRAGCIIAPIIAAHQRDPR